MDLSEKKLHYKLFHRGTMTIKTFDMLLKEQEKQKLQDAERRDCEMLQFEIDYA